jgi:antitoxin (DNA-binding transcriptional repressor) of toxin-antitoxin stability system
MSDAEVARDFHAVLENVAQGAEVIVERTHRTVAVIKPPERPGRSIDECSPLPRNRGYKATLDENFAQDLKDIIDQRKPLDPSRWE